MYVCVGMHVGVCVVTYAGVYEGANVGICLGVCAGAYMVGAYMGACNSVYIYVCVCVRVRVCC